MASERRQPRSFRIRESLMSDLERRARDLGVTYTALVERYIGEGVRRDEHPLITYRDGAAGRRAALVGTRLDVWQVIETVRNAENPREAAEVLRIPEAHVQACIRYYAAYKDEIDEWTERMHAIAEQEEDAWRREQAVLA